MSNPLTPSSSASGVGISDSAVPFGETTPSGVLGLNCIPFNPDLQVSFYCPECEHTCCVLWEHLALGMECPACGSSFHILPDRLQKREHQSPLEITFPCPRCRHSNTLLASRAAQGATCSGCQLELLPGPDKKLHAPRELKEIKLKARQQSYQPHTNLIAGLDPDKLKLLLISSGAVLSLMFLFWVGAWLFHTPTVEELSVDFTRNCLAGNESAAEELIATEDHQRSDFKHWQIMHFSSLSVAVKNAKDWPEIAVTVVKDEPTQKTLWVEMASPFIGKRTVTQIWQQDATSGDWRFDAATTLKNLHAAD